MGDPWSAMVLGCCSDALQAAGAQLPMEAGQEAENMADLRTLREDVPNVRTDPELVAAVVGVVDGLGRATARTWAWLGGQNAKWMLPGQGWGVQAACSALAGPSAGLLMLHEKVCWPQSVAVAVVVAAVAAAVALALHIPQHRTVTGAAEARLTGSKILLCAAGYLSPEVCTAKGREQEHDF